MNISEFKVPTSTLQPRKMLTMDRSDFPLTVQYGETTYVLISTKSKKLLLQKPLE